jgi:putative membrane protein
MMFGYGDWGWPVFHGLGGILMVFSTLVAAGIVLAFLRRMGRAAREGGGGDRALKILRERYARGEITEEQFEQMKRELD